MQTQNICQCGCGSDPGVYVRTIVRQEKVIGEPRRFLPGHYNRGAGRVSANWKGGRIVKRGYVLVAAHGHHRAGSNGYAYEHVLIAEKALGRPLETKHPVHHFDGIPSHNQNANLVICEDNNFHRLLHVRTRIVKMGGDPNFEALCYSCHLVKARAEFYRRAGNLNGLGICKSCGELANQSHKRTAKGQEANDVN